MTAVNHVSSTISGSPAPDLMKTVPEGYQRQGNRPAAQNSLYAFFTVMQRERHPKAAHAIRHLLLFDSSV